MTEIKNDDLEKVIGGVFALGQGDGQTYQLYYHDEPLPMGSTVSALCKQYDGMEKKLKDALGAFVYMAISSKTLNELCAMVGEEVIQEKLNEN